jgi:protein SCO1/2
MACSRAACVFAMLSCLAAALGGSAARADVKPLAARVGVDEHVGQSLPLDLTVTDQRGQRRALAELLQPGKPMLLSLAYYHCPGLCDISLRELATRLRDLGWKLGTDYTALTISIDPHDTPPAAAAKRASVINLMHVNAPEAWPFTVADPITLQHLTQLLGYRYDYDAPTKQYAHPAVSFVLTPDGKIARYLYGPTLELQSVRLALREARVGRGAASAVIDRTVLSCFQWDAKSHRYELLILGVVRIGAALFALLLALAILIFVRRGRARRAASSVWEEHAER